MSYAIETRSLGVTYGDDTALEDLSFTVTPGSVTAVLGPNGAGKTTLIKTLSTLVRPTSGKASVAGWDVVYSAARVRRTIGLSGQYSAVDADLTVAENLRLVGQLSGVADPVGRARALTGELDLVDIVERRVGQLSGGNQRRVDLALSLVAEPAVLFLDEPTTGLDPRARLALWDAVAALARSGTSVLLTTQYLEEADHLADRILVLDAGRRVAEGTPTELKRRLGGHVLSVGIPSRADAELLQQIGAAHPSVVRTAESARAVAFNLDEPAGAIDLISRIAEHHIDVDDLRVTTPTLDDVFLSLTGAQST